MKHGFKIALAVGTLFLAACTESEDDGINASIQIITSAEFAYLIPASATGGKPLCLADFSDSALTGSSNPNARLVLIPSIPSLDSLDVGNWTGLSGVLDSSASFAATEIHITVANHSRIAGTYQVNDDLGDPVGPKRSFNAMKCPDFDFDQSVD